MVKVSTFYLSISLIPFYAFPFSESTQSSALPIKRPWPIIVQKSYFRIEPPTGAHSDEYGLQFFIQTLIWFNSISSLLDKFKDTCKSHAAACPRECTYYKYEYQSSLLMELGDEIMLEGFNRIPDWKKNRDQSLRYIRWVRNMFYSLYQNERQWFL